MKDKEGLVHDYMQRRHITAKDYVQGFHAAMVYTTLMHMHQVRELVGIQYTSAEALAAFTRDIHLLQQHTTELYGRREAQRLAAAAQHEFRLTG